MSDIFLIHHPALFQGEKYLAGGENYFEGWYYKLNGGEKNLAVIPGVSVSGGGKTAFVQILRGDKSRCVEYGIERFSFCANPFYVKIGNNIFSLKNIHLDISGEKSGITAKGNIKFYTGSRLKTGVLSPNIMGPFSYIPFMECNHAVLCMKNRPEGKLRINGQNRDFTGGAGYIEKDWGRAFPKGYIWRQGNCFGGKDASFMLAAADIPFGPLSFTGLICVVAAGGRQYRFATYNGAAIKKLSVDKNNVSAVLKKGRYKAFISVSRPAGAELAAPDKSGMARRITETLSARAEVVVEKGGKALFSGTSCGCGLEVSL